MYASPLGSLTTVKLKTVSVFKDLPNLTLCLLYSSPFMATYIFGYASHGVQKVLKGEQQILENTYRRYCVCHLCCIVPA